MINTFFAIFVILIAMELYIRVFGNYCEPWFDKKEKIVKRKPDTEGIYKTEFTNTGYYRINNEGWNSHRDYNRRKENGKGNTEARSLETGVRKQKIRKVRIAIVGHSNIEGLRVPVEKTLSKILEDNLNKNGIPTEVYAFGFGGMHIAQAMHVSRYVVNQFQPDLLIIGTMLDDFWAYSTSKKNFLNLSIDNGTVLEVLPQKYVYEENSPFSFLYFSKLIYYLDKKTGIGESINALFKKEPKQSVDNEGMEVISTSDMERTYKHLFDEFNRISQMGTHKKVPVFFLKFPNSIPSYNYDYKMNMSFSHRKENLLEKYISTNSFKIIELETAFLDDYKVNGQKFDFKNDYHYNEQAHKVIGRHLSDFIQLYLQE